jgi:hypothetical protein
MPNPTLQQRQQAQRTYDQAGEHLRPSMYRNFCGHGLSQNERTVIERYTNPGDAVLEIGPGMFARTAPFYLNRNVDFFGIDPLNHIVADGNYAHKTVLSNLSPAALQSPVLADQTFSFVGIFGSVFNGVISEERTRDFWSGLGLLVQEHQATIAFDTLIAPYVGRTSEEQTFRNQPTGSLMRVGVQQYYPTLPEIQRHLDTHNMKIVETLDDAPRLAGGHTRRLFVLRSSN